MQAQTLELIKEDEKIVDVYQLVLKVLKVKILKHYFCSILRKHEIIKIYG